MAEGQASFSSRSAYQDALAIYREGSLATYSLFSPDDRVQILNAIEKAYITLIDEDKRAAYDRMLAVTAQVENSDLDAKVQNRPIPLFNKKNSLNPNELVNRIKIKSAQQEVIALFKEIMGKDLVSGEDLRKLRKALDVDIFEVYLVTKISVSVIKAIENNRYEDLPADVYLSNFLRSYAEVLQLDAQRIMDGYFRRMSLALKDDH